MSRILRNLVPSLVQRRILLLAGLVVAVIFSLGAQLASLTLVNPEPYREKAESVLVQRQLIPTRRGRIFDRKGRLLAHDRLSYDVAVDYSVISGAWTYNQARRAAYRANRQQWGELSSAAREQLVEQFRPEYDAQVNQLWGTLSEIGQLPPGELERRRHDVRRRVAEIFGVVLQRQIERRQRELDEPVEAAEVARPVGVQKQAHPLLFDITPTLRARVEHLVDLARAGDDQLAVWREVQVTTARRRAYPTTEFDLTIDTATFPAPLRRSEPVNVHVDGVGVHIIGGMRDVWKEDVDQRPFRTRQPDGEWTVDRGGYLPGDRVGRWGVEASLEDQLRGLRGQRIAHLETMQQSQQEPQPGNDVVLTVDMRLQARVKAIMQPSMGLMKSQPWHRKEPPDDPRYVQIGQPLNGAAVILEVETGQVLAAVSMPGFSHDMLERQPDRIWKDRVNTPFAYRVVERSYQPGSTVKPLVLAAAVNTGEHHAHDAITCSGYFDPTNRNVMRCWIYKMYGRTHGPLQGREAICRSCNIFFYRLGADLGLARISSWFDHFGMGRHTYCGLPDAAGDLPDPHPREGESNTDWQRRMTNRQARADATYMGIGQGPVRWTPLQAAGAYATLARGGSYINPTFILNGETLGRERIRRPLALASDGVEQALAGLYDAANTTAGTAHHISSLAREPIFNIDGVRIMAKSGTAAAVPLRIDGDGDDRITSDDPIVRLGDHAWCIALVQPEGSAAPKYVAVAVVEFAGSGGAVAGPVVNQLIHALRAEGYL